MSRSQPAVALLMLAACRPHPGASPPTAAASASTAPTDAGHATPSADLAPDEQARLLSEIEKQLVAHYVSPEVGAQMAAALAGKAADGGYDGLTSASAFADAITADMRAVSHDRHALLERTPPPDQATAQEAAWAKEEADNHASAGLGPTTRWPGNVAEVVINSFEPDNALRPTLAARLSAVADADALILDLRNNHGGAPWQVAFVASYLFGPAPVHLNDLWWRDTNSTDASFTLADVPGKRFGPTKPVVVLTSQKTFSAAEEFAYDLQCLKRATIVGEVTAGGAHPVNPLKLSPLFSLRVPTGRAINPVTHTDWEGVGVRPDIVASSADALDAALAFLRRAHGESSSRSPTE